jgi:NUDIX domain
MRAIVPLETEPGFRPFPFATPLDGPIRRAVDDAALVLSRTMGRFDGPIAFCHGVSRDGAILRRHGRYAEAMVVFTEPSQAYRLGFALGVQLFVERQEGLVLFQQRGPSIGRDPLLWTASASGGLAHAEEPRDAVLADAAEEIGLGVGDLPGFRPIAVVVSDDTGSALVVYHARLREGAEPEPNPAKVAELFWATSPAGLGAQVSADTVGAWEALERWRSPEPEATASAPT